MSETRRYKDQWQGYGSQSKATVDPSSSPTYNPGPPYSPRRATRPSAPRSDFFKEYRVTAQCVPSPTDGYSSQNRMDQITPSLPPCIDDSELQLLTVYTPLRLKRVASQNRSEQIPTRYFFFYGFVCPPLWLLGILVLIPPIRRILPFIFISGHNAETHAEEKGWASLYLVITSILSVVGAVICLFLITRRDAGIRGQ
ncbi:hypothetical protein IW261DRAFT_1422269 [Armillaria novae-zelandiae]|uniref:Uncharacterized protein n=1 Tax=Armillaria novae-zelandiae TaxID=153914 RepID=A0AA39UAQ1_9AGAR|nr:hypothetical protein IW261DRAFT_1422269 [Armillaria novae-zelandiae]